MQRAITKKLPSSQDFFDEHGINADDLENARITAHVNVLKRLVSCVIRENLIEDAEEFLAESLSTNKHLEDPLKFLDFIKPKIKNNLSKFDGYANLSVRDIEAVLDSFDLRWERFKFEIECTVKNDIPHVAYREKLDDKLIQLCAQASYKSLYELVLNSDDSLRFLEQWSAMGHPYHPCYKSKLGMDAAEIINYSPEFNQKVQLVVAALHKDIALIQGSTERVDAAAYRVYFKENFEDVFMDWSRALLDKGLDPVDYIPMPIHPWQAEHAIVHKLPLLIEHAYLIIFNDVYLPSYAAVSLRTMIPDLGAKQKLKPHLKLPVTAQMTSVIRYISPSKIYNSTILSKLVRDILKTENNFNETLYFLDEELSVSLDNLKPEYCDETDAGKELTKGQYVHYDKEHTAEERKRHLSVTYRENPLKYQDEGQLIVPLTALFMNSPISKKPFLLEIMEGSALEYFKDYVSLVVRGPLQAYLKYGISLECHQQNSCLVFEAAKPVKLLLRDTGGLEIITPRLSARGYSPDLHPDTNICFSDTFPRKQLIHGLFNSHLVELIKIISKHYQIDSKVLYQELAKIVHEELLKAKTYMNEDDWLEEKKAFFEDDWEIKTLFLMRIVNSKEIFLKAENPLKS